MEGRGSRDFLAAKELMYREPAVWHALLERLADGFATYVRAQVDAGADVIQLFDSWAGILSPADYEEFAAPYSRRVLEAVDVPTIHFGTGTAGLLTHMRDAGGDVIGLDWRVELDRAWATVGPTAAFRAISTRRSCLARGSTSRRRRETCSAAPTVGRGHVFNLGHGVLPQTDPDVLARLTKLVQEHSQ